MKLNFAAARMGAVWLLVGAACPLPGGEPAASDWRTVNVIQTNRSTRVVTNVIEVRMPDNVFVNEYRTNRFQRTLTNIVEVPVTNWATKTVTNRVAVNLFRTNIVNRYQTNWTTRTQTNWEEITVTNWATVRLTNRATLTLTNWETVLVTRTNWIKQPATNVVEANVPAGVMTVMAREPAPPPAPKNELERPDFVPDTLVMDAIKTSRPADSTGVEVNFKVHLANDAEAALQVQQWRVEREDRAVLIFSQAQEFKRVLPPGRYQIQVKARRDTDSPVLALQSGLEVTQDAVARR